MFKKHLQKYISYFLKHRKLLIAIVVFLMLLGLLPLKDLLRNENNFDPPKNNLSNFNSTNFSLPKNLNFANELVPLADSLIYKMIQKEFKRTTQWQTEVELIFKRSKVWFPIIEPILKNNNIPDDFKYVAVIESKLSNVVSNQGAVGFWQLLETTGTTNGLEISAEVDERFNVAKATQAACTYFNNSYKQFKNWTLVAASYNAGAAGIQGLLDNQNKNNFYQLNLNNETESFVYRLLAMKEVLLHPTIYGVSINSKKYFSKLTFNNFSIDSTVNDLKFIAQSQKISLHSFYYFNPWIIGIKLTNERRRKYTFQIPKEDEKVLSKYITDYENLSYSLPSNTNFFTILDSVKN